MNNKTPEKTQTVEQQVEEFLGAYIPECAVMGMEDMKRELMEIYKTAEARAIEEYEHDLDNHAISQEMLHVLADHLGLWFKPTEDGSYTLEKKDL